MSQPQKPTEFVPDFESGMRIFRAPGRVNLIGEHTDYNNGLVMPVAIDFATWVAVAPLAERRVQVESRNLRESFEFGLDEGSPEPRHAWTDYVQGVALTLEREDFHLRGAQLVIESNVPMGAGLSSSAALEVATALALLANSDLKLEPLHLAQLCQRAENEFAGVRCGIMDQFTSCCAREGKALLLNCQTLAARYLPLPNETRLVICNTMVRHELAAGTYNERRAECEKAAQLLGVDSLGALSLREFQQRAPALPEILRKRAQHVVTENERVKQAAVALEQNDLETFARALNESHISLQKDFEVSCDELDLMVELAREQPGTFGARLTGGGFGGCTINFVSRAEVGSFVERVSVAYEHETGLTPAIYVCRAAAGAGEVESATFFEEEERGQARLPDL